jgi:excisionase family DNA binding protein
VDGDDNQLLTVSEVAEYLRIDPESARRWLREGKLSGINLGRGPGWRIRRGDLAQFLAERSRTTESPWTPNMGESTGIAASP